jgi:hypothetical protein
MFSSRVGKKEVVAAVIYSKDRLFKKGDCPDCGQWLNQ